MGSKLHGIVSPEDAIEFAAVRCRKPAGRVCYAHGCCMFSWCPRASTSREADLSWLLELQARRRKVARDRARRAGR